MTNEITSNSIKELEVNHKNFSSACTVLISLYDSTIRKIVNSSVNACLAPLCSIDGKHVITIEGIGSSHNPHPVQERIALLHGSQCGFCTPGIVMSLYALLRNNPEPSKKEIEECFDGNLCRCTGYRPILDAAKTFASVSKSISCENEIGDEKRVDSNGCDGNNTQEKTSQNKGCGRENCCQLNNRFEDFVIFDEFPKYKLKRYDPSQELIFPPSLINRVPKPLFFIGRKTKWFRPINLDQLLDLKRVYPNAKLVSGNTEIGIETKFKKLKYPIQIYVGEVKALQSCEFGDNGLTIGANITLSKFQQVLQDACKRYKSHQTQVFQAILSNLRWFAGNQIRNVATPAGNIVTGSPISDLNPIFLATNTLFTLTSSSSSATTDSNNNKNRRVIPSESFWIGYRKTILTEQEILEQIFVPCSAENEFVSAYKQAKRRDDDIAIVNAGLRVVLDKEHFVQDISLAFGGMGGVTLRATQAESFVKGRKWGDEKVLQNLLETILQELQLNFSAPGGMASYRRSLVAGFIYKFWHDIGTKIGLYTNKNSSCIIEELTEIIEREISQGVQSFGRPEDGKNHVGESIPHASALKQVTGEAVYLDDIPKAHGELYGTLLLSQEPHAKILSIDACEALAQPGVRGFFSAKDVPGENKWGPIFHDEEVFASTEVYCVGQIIGLIVADTQTLAQEAVRLVKVEYERLSYILTIEEAIDKQSFFSMDRQIVRGDVDNAFKEADYIFEGSSRIGGQEHFYLETQASLVIPKPEDHEFEVHASTQHLTETQIVLSSVLGIRANKVVCRVKRLGGGFGGKETRSVPLTAALAVGAWHLNRPIRCMLDRDEDMVISGQRHPALGRWRIGMSKDGKIKGLDLDIYTNGGWSSDLSSAVLDRAITHADNCYYIANMRIRGKICKTNIHSNTAFRGFGGPQGMMIMENIINEVADSMGISVDTLREINLYKEGQKTHYNQLLTDWHLPQLYQQLKQTSDFEKRRHQVDSYNASHKWRKRGLAFVPTKFGLSYTALHLNQAGALVHVYLDGSVLVSHGGVEMGQGLHTKLLQIAAETLSVPLDQIHIMETSTTTVANMSATAASVSSDINGYAVADACQKLAERLRPYREKTQNATFKEICQAAYFDRVNLSANGFYKTPDIGYSFEKNEGQMFYYFTMGAAVTEIELDLLTGDHTILRTDLCMDIGRSLNYAIDIGQIEGGFVQGVGWCTIEESLFFPNGQLFTRGPGNYKIPGFRDIPQDFRVSTYQGTQYPHLKTIHSSKGVGEPPLFLGSSVFFAIRDAIKAGRQVNFNKYHNQYGYLVQANSINEIVTLSSPATPERIRMACIDHISKAALVSRKEGEKPWNLMA
ncbi:3654_t:CDS:10 [Ambispora gerdemannii]|uniref:xanthine dehydrogenase n=1 Tax=Ambispora gerdemannii TaxID=144530 RepID=A0A9N8ZKK5_9GLOM|nr:3654_t:CDS:10 [Ambispora gerdemannii]